MPENFQQLSFLTPDAGAQNWFDATLCELNVTQKPGWPDAFGNSLRCWLQENGVARVPTLSLFSGGGGLDIAFHDAGFDIVELVEIDPRFAATLAENAKPGRLLAGGNVICADIRAYTPSADLKVDFIIGGPPCQTFSAAGRRASGVKGTNDPRGTLFEDYVRILKQLRPKAFLFENVYGIVGAESGEPWKQIQAAFCDAGYDISSRILDAADFGVPQHRERLFIVGRRFDAGCGGFKFPRPTHGPDAYPPSPFYPAGKAVEGVEADDDTGLKVGGRWKSLLPEIPPGLNYSYYTSEMGHPKPVFAWRSKFSDFLYKADPEVPVRTIKAQGGAFTGPLSWKNRHFSADELKRLQTFPDDYKIAGNRGNQVHQIGNSVPPQLGRILAMAVLDQLFAVPLPAKLQYLDDGDILGFRKRKRALTNRYRLAAATAIEALPQAEAAATFPTSAGGSDEFSLGSQFSLSFPPKINEPTYKSSFHIDNSQLLIELNRDNCNNNHFIIKLHPNKNGWNIPIDRVNIKSSYKELKDVTAAWKYFEFLLKKLYRIDDLVQLNGYYQYGAKLRAEFIEFTEENSGLMKILSSICDGNGVSYQTNLNDLAQSWSTSEDDALHALHTLRSIGFEVRNHSTNGQMAEGEYLIPYRFPTLNPRSVQLFKTL